MRVRADHPIPLMRGYEIRTGTVRRRLAKRADWLARKYLEHPQVGRGPHPLLDELASILIMQDIFERLYPRVVDDE